MDKIKYHEWVPTGLFVKIIVLIVSLSIIFLLLIFAVFFHPLNMEAFIGFGASILTLVFVLALFFNFRGIRIQISSKCLSVDYGLFNHKSVKLDEIVSRKIVKASFSRFGGVGVRYGLNGSSAYTTSFGNAVEIVPKKGRTFVFSSNNPQQICKIIKKDPARANEK